MFRITKSLFTLFFISANNNELSLMCGQPHQPSADLSLCDVFFSEPGL